MDITAPASHPTVTSDALGVGNRPEHWPEAVRSAHSPDATSCRTSKNPHLSAATYIQQVESASTKQLVRSADAGFIRRIDIDALCEASFGSTSVLVIHPKVGEYVARGSILATLDTIGDDDTGEDIRNAFVLDRERTTLQDPLFAIRQLVDIALKALSPGINDPTTAEYVLYHLDDAIGRLAERVFPSNVYITHDRHTRIIAARPTWDDFVQAAFSQICEAARSDAHVTKTILDVLHDLALRLPKDAHATPVRKLVTELRYTIVQQPYSPVVKAEIIAIAERVDCTLAEI